MGIGGAVGKDRRDRHTRIIGQSSEPHSFGR